MKTVACVPLRFVEYLLWYPCDREKIKMVVSS